MDREGNKECSHELFHGDCLECVTVELAAKEKEIERLTKERDELKNDRNNQFLTVRERTNDIIALRQELAIERKALEMACENFPYSDKTPDYFRKQAREK